MRKIRINSFETNSSSTHNLCIVDTDLFTRWVNGNNTWFCSWDEDFITLENIEDEIKKELNITELTEEHKELVAERLESYGDNGYRSYSEFRYEELTMDLGDGRTVLSYAGYDN